MWVDRNFRFLLVAPAIVLILLLTIYPLGYSVWVSFVNYDVAIPGHAWVGLDNFRVVWSDSIARRAIVFTLLHRVFDGGVRADPGPSIGSRDG